MITVYSFFHTSIDEHPISAESVPNDAYMVQENYASYCFFLLCAPRFPGKVTMWRICFLLFPLIFVTMKFYYQFTFNQNATSTKLTKKYLQILLNLKMPTCRHIFSISSYSWFLETEGLMTKLKSIFHTHRIIIRIKLSSKRPQTVYFKNLHNNDKIF